MNQFAHMKRYKRSEVTDFEHVPVRLRHTDVAVSKTRVQN